MLFIGSPPSNPYTHKSWYKAAQKSIYTWANTGLFVCFFHSWLYSYYFFPSKSQSISSKNKTEAICLDFPSLLPLPWQFLSLFSLSTFSRSVVIWPLLLQLLQLATASHSDPRWEFQSCMRTKSPPSFFKQVSIYAGPSFSSSLDSLFSAALVTTQIKGLGSYLNLLCLFSRLKGSSR